MSKKNRELKRHYRYIQRKLRNFTIELTDDSWYSFWHTHLDWDGITNTSEKHRRLHIQYYIRFLLRVEELTEETNRDFQTWIYLDRSKGYYDALYFHTQNPNDEFPIKFDNVEWHNNNPSIPIGFLDLSKFKVGGLKDKEGHVSGYIIQKKGLGLEIA